MRGTGSMIATGSGGIRRRWRFLCIVAFLVVVLHHLLMASGWHAAMVRAGEQSRHHATAGMAQLAGIESDIAASSDHRPSQGELPAGDCRVELVLVPLLLSLLLVAGACACGSAGIVPPFRRIDTTTLPYPASSLDAGQRRALLQVFLI